jgi:hypothetical protein
MEIANLATTLQIAWYFNRAEKISHPSLKASILGSLVKKIYPNNTFVRFADGKYYITSNWNDLIECSSFEWISNEVKNYIQNKFAIIQNLVKNDPMLFIR